VAKPDARDVKAEEKVSANRGFQRCCKKGQAMTLRDIVFSALAAAKGRLAGNNETSTLVLTLHVQ
jgi:hypothetical protein